MSLQQVPHGAACVPLNVTVLVPWVEPKFFPFMTTGTPTAADEGEISVIPGFEPTTKNIKLLTFDPTVTVTGPVVAPVGTAAVILTSLHIAAVAEMPLNLIALVPCIAPKFFPETVTEVPTEPKLGDRLKIAGVVPAEKTAGLLATPATVTSTFPVVTPVGAGTTIAVAFQLVGAALTPLNATVLAPWVAPKFAPEIVTDVPAAPEFGLTLLMCGADTTLKLMLLLAMLPTVTTMFPLVAPDGTGATILVSLQLFGVATVPLNFIVLLPCVAPKLEPVTVTHVPTAPAVGLSMVILGVKSTVNATPLLATPPTVTTTFPVDAPAGTETEMLPEFQLDGVSDSSIKRNRARALRRSEVATCNGD